MKRKTEALKRISPANRALIRKILFFPVLTFATDSSKSSRARTNGLIAESHRSTLRLCCHFVRETVSFELPQAAGMKFNTTPDANTSVCRPQALSEGVLI